MTARHSLKRAQPVADTVRALLCLAALLAGCHRAAATDGPSLRSLTPARGDIGLGQVVEVVVDGKGFDSLNTVSFGELVLRQVPRLSATKLRFAVPQDDVQRPGRGEAPPARLSGGTYTVRVNTARGASNGLAFTLLNGQGIR